jgi:hypothetical protein
VTWQAPPVLRNELRGALRGAARANEGGMVRLRRCVRGRARARRAVWALRVGGACGGGRRARGRGGGARTSVCAGPWVRAARAGPRGRRATSTRDDAAQWQTSEPTHTHTTTHIRCMRATRVRTRAPPLTGGVERTCARAGGPHLRCHEQSTAPRPFPFVLPRLRARAP